MNSKIDFVNGKTLKALLAMVVPVLLSMILMMAYNMVDSLWIGNLLGEQGYAALTDSTSVILILNALALGSGNGISILVSQVTGAGKKEKTNKIIGAIVVMAAVFSIVIAIIAESGLWPLIHMLQTPVAVEQAAYDYLQIYLLGYVFIFIYLQFTAIMRSFGDPVFQLKGMLATTVLNAVLDPLMINWMGLKGAAIATVISEIVCLLYAFYYYKKKEMFKICISKEGMSYAKDILKDAVLAAVQQCIPAISSAVMVALVGRYGLTAVSGYGVATKLEIFLFYPAMAVNMGLTAIVGQCIGAGRYDRVKDYTKYACITGGIFIAVLSAAVILLSGSLSGLFVKGAVIAEIVKQFFFTISIGYVLYMLTSCFLGKFSGLGKPGLSMILFVFYYIVVRIPLAQILIGSMGLNGIWIAILISHVLSTVLAIIINFVINRKKEGVCLAQN